MTHKFTRKYIIAFLFVLLTHAWALAEQNGIGVSLVSYTIENGDSINLGYTITINAQVTNFDSVPFEGLLNFGLRNTHENLTSTGVFQRPVYAGRNISLNPHETVPAVFGVHISPQYFTPGPDVVVVWPICSQQVGDSIVINFKILDPATAINDEQADIVSYAIIGNKIILESASQYNPIKQVRLYNMLGQQLLNQRYAGINEIQLPELPKGIYLCELIGSNNTRKVIRFYH
jgi:hypothetical protein